MAEVDLPVAFELVDEVAVCGHKEGEGEEGEDDEIDQADRDGWCGGG